MQTTKAELEKELALIADKIQAVKEAGFGEVRILIQNGAIYRILVTRDELRMKSEN